MKKWVEEKVALSRRAARPSVCKRCGQDVLIGPDNDQCAFTATIDPDPITVDGEIAAVVQNRWTYDAHAAGSGIGIELIIRTPDLLHQRTTDVMVEHRCGAPPLPTQPSVVATINREPLPDTPPF